MPTLTFFTVSEGWAWATLVLLTPIYFMLHIYLEAIIPDAYGVTESCCFCFRKRQANTDDEDQGIDDDMFQADQIETNGSIQRESEQLGAGFETKYNATTDEAELKTRLIGGDAATE